VLAGTGVKMAVPIDLDGELELGAVEVEDVGAYAVLPAKSIAQESAIAQLEPQALFGEGLSRRRRWRVSLSQDRLKIWVIERSF